MDVNPAYSRKYNNPTPHTSQSEAPGQGLLSVVNGEIYYSPNATRKLKASSVDKEKYSTNLAEFQQPRPWQPETEWLGFVPRSPVYWTGPMLEVLSYIPRWMTKISQGKFVFYQRTANEWLTLEKIICKMVRILREQNSLVFKEPPPPSSFKYDTVYHSQESTKSQVLKARDWFAMWIGLLYWETCKCPGTVELEGRAVPLWHSRLLVTLKKDGTLDQTAEFGGVKKDLAVIIMDGLRCSHLLQRGWDVERVGIILDSQSGGSSQPQPEWFIQWAVPVWYRWGVKEQEEHHRGRLRWQAPLAAQLQQATTLMYKNIPMESQTENVPWTPQSPDFVPPMSFNDLPPPSPLQLSSSTQATEKPTTSVHSREGDATEKAKSGSAFWERFWKAREELWERKKARETLNQKQARQNREKKPPRSSAPVYVWEWDDKKGEMVRTLIPRHERDFTLDEYGPLQKRYDSFLNEWNCCEEWGPPPDENETPLYYDDNMYEEEIAKSREQGIVDLLYRHFGFLHPIPIPLHVDSRQEPVDRQGLIGLLGLRELTQDDAWFKQPIGIISTRFLRNFLRQDPQKPNAEEWDLSESCRNSIAYTSRLPHLRRVANKECTMYMLDFAQGSTVPWKIAVYTAAAALYICRLGPRWNEEEMALDLLQNGIPFRTLQEADTLKLVEDDNMTTNSLPLRYQDHVYSRADYEYYQRQCQGLLNMRRGRAALLRGGYICRIATGLISKSEALKGPSGRYVDPRYTFNVKDEKGVEYVDDELTSDELDLLCGIYVRFTGRGMQTSKISWWPLRHLFEGSGEDRGWWTKRDEELFVKREHAIMDEKGEPKKREPLGPAQWREKLRGFADIRRAIRQRETWSKSFIAQHVAGF